MLFLEVLRYTAKKTVINEAVRCHCKSLHTCADLLDQAIPLAQSFEVLSLSEFPMTDTELKLIAAAAIIGLSKSPKNGYRTPAAKGTWKIIFMTTR